MHYAGTRARALATPAPLVWPCKLFLATLLVPFIISAGSLRLSVYRILLLAAILPLLWLWASGRAGRIRLADAALFLLCAWVTISLSVVHGPAASLEPSAIFFIETMGGYLMARVLVRDAQAFVTVVRFFVLLVAALSPFAIFEALTGRNLLLEAAHAVFTSYHFVVKEQRLSLNRVQATLEHPILFGVFCGSAVSLAYMAAAYGRALPFRAALAAWIAFTACLSLSAGPMTGLAAQVGLIAWNEALCRFRWRWWLLAGLAATGVAVVETVAARPTPEVFIDYFSFDKHSAYNRILIWNFTTAEIARHPVFGIGFDEWERPIWMSSSVDMFWVIFGLRHGLPATTFTVLAFAGMLLALIFRRGLSGVDAQCRDAVVFTLVAIILTGWTVHYWNATYVLVVFLLGSGAWLLEPTAGTPRADVVPETTRRGRLRYGSFDTVPHPAGDRRSNGQRAQPTA